MAFEFSPSRCPKCGASVDKLYYVRFSTNVGCFSIPLGHEDDPFGESSGKTEYCCPECCETLFTEEQEAVQFLGGRGEGL